MRILIGGVVRILAVGLMFVPVQVTAVTTVDYTEQITQKQEEINSINKKINELSHKRSQTLNEQESIAVALEQLKAQLAKADAELQKTKVTITDVKYKSNETGKRVDSLHKQMLEKRDELHSLLRQLYEFEQVSLVQVFFDSQSLSDVLNQRNVYQILQARAVRVINDMHEQENDLTKEQDTLDQQAQDLSQLQQILGEQAQTLEQKKAEQKKFLQQKKQQQAVYESLIAEAQQARDEIKRQVFTLQNGSIKISLSTANDMARFAGRVTGIRPALIMAVLKIESGVGTNLGSGSFPTNMPLLKNQDAFLRITKKIGIDPYKAPLSRAGAMGPAQIMPTTWEGMEPRIQQLMNKQLVSPYELADAFTATGIFLADRGAQNPLKEAEALQRYVGGIYWEGQSWYSEKVLAVAKEYEAQGL